MNSTSRIIRVAAALGLGLALALLTACAARSAQAPATSSAPTAPPTLQLVSPSEGEVLQVGSVTVKVETTGLEFVMPSGTNVPGEGHVHFTLDDRPFVMSIEREADLEDVEPGEHTLVAELVQNDTSSFEPPITQEITFVVE